MSSVYAASDSSLDSSLTASSDVRGCMREAMATVSADLPERTVPLHPGDYSSLVEVSRREKGGTRSQYPEPGKRLPKGFVKSKSAGTKRAKTEFLRDAKRNATGFLGVKHRADRNDFVAYIRDPSGRKVYAGCAKTAEDAAHAYDRKAVELYGSKAVTNFPRSEQP